MAKFPGAEWVQALMDKLNTDGHYAQVARNWEGDMRFVIETDEGFEQPVWIYLDLWHGKCRQGYLEDPATSTINPAFTLRAPYGNFSKVLKGQLDPMQALLTRKFGVQGNFSVFMRNVPTVLDFVRCCREVTDP